MNKDMFNYTKPTQHSMAFTYQVYPTQTNLSNDFVMSHIILANTERVSLIVSYKLCCAYMTQIQSPSIIISCNLYLALSFETNIQQR